MSDTATQFLEMPGIHNEIESLNRQLDASSEHFDQSHLRPLTTEALCRLATWEEVFLMEVGGSNKASFRRFGQSLITRKAGQERDKTSENKKALKAQLL